MNIFQNNYEIILKSWYDLRKSVINSDIETKCIKIDAYWQTTPLVNHYLHPDNILEWPDPWELIHENTYCLYARGLGMIYTLLLLGVTDVDFVEAKDDNSTEVVLVLVDSAKYILNYWPNTVVNNKLKDFTVTKRINIAPIIKKIGIK